MAVPKRKVSKERQGKRRAKIKLALPTLTKCQNCGATKLPHHECPECSIKDQETKPS
jgi:large subunit ribosomal protein L32